MRALIRTTPKYMPYHRPFWNPLVFGFDAYVQEVWVRAKMIQRGFFDARHSNPDVQGGIHPQNRPQCPLLVPLKSNFQHRKPCVFGSASRPGRPACSNSGGNDHKHACVLIENLRALIWRVYAFSPQALSIRLAYLFMDALFLTPRIAPQHPQNP